MKNPKYKIFTDNEKKVYAVSSFAGRPIRGVAKCSDKDSFNLETGKEIAKARCALKVADKRLVRAAEKLSLALKNVHDANAHLDRMNEYYWDSVKARDEAEKTLEDIEEICGK